MKRSYRVCQVIMTWFAIIALTVDTAMAGHLLGQLRSCGGSLVASSMVTQVDCGDMPDCSGCGQGGVILGAIRSHLQGCGFDRCLPCGQSACEPVGDDGCQTYAPCGDSMVATCQMSSGCGCGVSSGCANGSGCAGSGWAGGDGYYAVDTGIVSEGCGSDGCVTEGTVENAYEHSYVHDGVIIHDGGQLMVTDGNSTGGCSTCNSGVVTLPAESGDSGVVPGEVYSDGGITDGMQWSPDEVISNGEVSDGVIVSPPVMMDENSVAPSVVPVTPDVAPPTEVPSTVAPSAADNTPPASDPANEDLGDMFDEGADVATPPADAAPGGLPGDELPSDTPAVEPPADELPTDEPPADDAAPEDAAELDDLFGTNGSPQSRTWADNTGKFSTEGQLVEITSTSIRLLKSNGRTCTVPMRRLSDVDFDYVQRIASQQGRPPIVRLATAK